MSKRFKHKQCVYCAREASSDTGDHIFPRSFFPDGERDSLPQVPACWECNNKKSHLENYLATLLPFGSWVPDAIGLLAPMVRPKLAKNQKLTRKLTEGGKRIWLRDRGVLLPAATLPFEPQKLHEFIRYAARGLAYHEWRTVVPSDYCIGVLIPTIHVKPLYEQLMRLRSSCRISRTLGLGRVCYEGVATNDPHVSLWRIKFHGGALFADLGASDDSGSEIFAVASRKMMPTFKYGPQQLEEPC